jgi:hypothetical protein
MAITMWDFSWLERRWPGAGYEDWDLALDELAERGYDAVRIDAYPHLWAAGPESTYTLLPCWDQHAWGAPGRVEVQVSPALETFVSKCRERNLMVGLSSWFRQDQTNARLKLSSPQALGEAWLAVLRRLDGAGLLDCVLYVDFTNEFPLRGWADFLYVGRDEPLFSRSEPWLAQWMAAALAVPRREYPGLGYTFSFCNELGQWQQQDVGALDLLELHIWMSLDEVSDFDQRVGYDIAASYFGPTQYANLIANGEQEYRSAPSHWQEALLRAIDDAARWSRASGKPLVTTEAWAVVNYKDFPMADWGWVKELCEVGVGAAAATGRWAALCTSNFCGPQFHGMWRDVAWHQRLTRIIRASRAEVSLARMPRAGSAERR